jgi:hypothetical protein
MAVARRFFRGVLFALCAGCCIFGLKPKGLPPAPEELSSPVRAFQVFRDAALKGEDWRAYCCFSNATQEHVDFYDFALGLKKKKYRKAFTEMVITEMREISADRWEYVTSYEKPYDVFEIVREDGRWKIHVPEQVFEEE